MYKELFSCKGKTAMVTGGAGLIGRGIVKALHEFGAEVYIADIDKNKADELIKDVAVKFVYLDIASEDSIQKAAVRGNKKIRQDRHTGKLCVSEDKGLGHKI